MVLEELPGPAINVAVSFKINRNAGLNNDINFLLVWIDTSSTSTRNPNEIGRLKKIFGNKLCTCTWMFQEFHFHLSCCVKNIIYYCQLMIIVCVHACYGFVQGGARCTAGRTGAIVPIRHRPCQRLANARLSSGVRSAKRCIIGFCIGFQNPTIS